MPEGSSFESPKKGGNFFAGLLFLIFGALLLCNAIFGIELFSMSNLWPCFVLVPGLCFEAGFFARRKDPGLLIPGGILTTIGLLFFVEVWTHWHFAAYTWPVYIIAVMVGLFQFYLFVGRPRGVFIVIAILGIVAATAICVISLTTVFGIVGHNLIVPIALVLVGALIIASGFRRK